MEDFTPTPDVDVLSGDAGSTLPVARAKLELPAEIRQQMADELAAMQKRIGQPTGNAIRVTQKKTFRLPNGEESAGPIHGVIVDFVSFNTLYEEIFDPDDITPPDCFAIGTDISTISPHETVLEPQSDKCATCAKNQWGSARRGKGKACGNNYKLAVLPPDANPDTPLQILKVSPTARRAFEAYVAGLLRTYQAPPRAFVTEISLDPATDYPSLRFGNPELNADLFALAQSRLEEARTLLNTPPEARVVDEQPKKSPARRGR
jgi:hypothetical protein